MAKEWFGGPNFVYAPQWSSGRSNDGANKKKYGNASTKRGRFNSNPTPSNHPSCGIARQSKLDKKRYETSPRVVKYIKSGLMKG